MCNHCVNHTTKGKSKACQQREDEDNMWLLESGASAHFTNNYNTFIKYHQYVKPHHSQTANGLAPVLDEGTVLIWFNGNVVQLLPTIYMPTCTFQLVSVGTLLKNNCLYVQALKATIFTSLTIALNMTSSLSTHMETALCTRSGHHQFTISLV